MCGLDRKEVGFCREPRRSATIERELLSVHVEAAMDPAVHTLITALHQSPCCYVMALTGGGTGVAAWLLSVPGGSRTVLEIAVPYVEEALCDYLGRRPESF